GGEIGTLQTLAATDVDDVCVSWCNGDRADRPGALFVEDRIPGAAVVRGFPDAAVHDADVEHIRLLWDTRARLRTAGAKRSDHPPSHLLKQRWVNTLSVERRSESERCNDGENELAAEGEHDGS